ITRRPESERADLRSRYVGVVLQSGNLLEHLELRDNVRAAQALAKERRRGDPDELLESVGLGHRRTARPSTVSGGEAARAGLAVALANDPPVLLADEPTGEVDAETESALLELFRARAAQGSAVVD